MIDVMIVDDYKVFITQFKRLGFWKRTTQFNLKYTETDSVNALRLLRENHVDILITDIKMPKLSGLELLTKVKEEKLCPCTIVLSEYTDFEYARMGIVLGAFDYIVKPVSEETLEAVLNRAAQSLQSNTPGFELSGVKEAAQAVASCINQSGTGLDIRVSSLFSECSQASAGNFIHHGVILSKACQMASEAVFEAHGWAANITSPLENVQQRIIGADSTELAKSLLNGYLQELYASVKQYYPPDMKSLTREIAEYILSHPQNKLTLTEVADACFVNKSHLSHVFKQSMGISFVEYVIQYKMQILKILISCTDLKLAEIAERLGYDDPKYMGQLFKSIYGIAPSDYKKMSAE